MSSSARVLIADNDPLMRAAVCSLLKAAGFGIVGEVENGWEAIREARALAPDLVILDVRMPVMDGFSAAIVLKQTLPDIRVVLLTLDADQFAANAWRSPGWILRHHSEDQFSSFLRSLSSSSFDTSLQHI